MELGAHKIVSQSRVNLTLKISFFRSLSLSPFCFPPLITTYILSSHTLPSSSVGSAQCMLPVQDVFLPFHFVHTIAILGLG